MSKIENKEKETLEQMNRVEQETLFNLGRVTCDLEVLKEQKKMVIGRISEIQTKRQAYINELQEKYGEGELNLDTGEFTSTK